MKLLLTSLFILLMNLQIIQPKKEQPIAIIIHGGAGTIIKENMSPEAEKIYNDKLDEAISAGYKILQEGGTSVDAVEATIRIMEDSRIFNAGRASVFNAEGKNEMDAAIMDGGTLKAGSVANIMTVKNPITAARAVMEKTAHVMITGRGADAFAKQAGLEIMDSSYFFDQKRYDDWKDAKEKEGLWTLQKPIKYGTVGCVALDKNGNLAAGTSTGGMLNKKVGRVGDSPIIGSGTYANNKTCGVSCTGQGEYFIRLNAAYDISAMIEYKHYSVKKAADELIFKKIGGAGALGGVIVMDAQGNFAMPFNTWGMYRASIDVNGKKTIKMFKE